MANIYILAEPLLESEGGFVDHPNDPGGPTNRGVTFATFSKHNFDNDRDGKVTVNDLKLLTDAQWTTIFSGYYWKKEYDGLYQPLADILVNNKWGSGSSNKMLFKPIDDALQLRTTPIINLGDIVEQQIFALIKLLATQWNFTRLMIANPKFKVFMGWHVKSLAWGFRFYSGHRFKLSVARKLILPIACYTLRE